MRAREGIGGWGEIGIYAFREKNRKPSKMADFCGFGFLKTPLKSLIKTMALLCLAFPGQFR